jgi:nicotinamidase-related amidase
MRQEYSAKSRLLDRFARWTIAGISGSCAAGRSAGRVHRMVNQFLKRATPFVRWIDESEPYSNEMVFEPSRASCYSSGLFSALLSQSHARIVLAGFAGESACLSTLIDGSSCNHKITHLCDASASHALNEMSADEVQRAVSSNIGTLWRGI